jgi:hypothetical protein
MNRSIIFQVLSACLLVVLAAALVDPFGLWMSGMMHMATLGGAVVAFGILALFVLAETGGDEREVSHRMLSGRAAFIAGGTVLLTAIVIQSIDHTLDSWLVYALVAMVLAKMCARIFSGLYR